MTREGHACASRSLLPAIGGLRALHWLPVEVLLVDETERGKGVGSRLAANIAG
jgi:hypothetical protein